MRMEGNWSVGHARGGVSESCRTTRLHLHNLAELANLRGRRFAARGTCARVHIYVRMEWKSTVDRA